MLQNYKKVVPYTHEIVTKSYMQYLFSNNKLYDMYPLKKATSITFKVWFCLGLDSCFHECRLAFHDQFKFEGS